MMAIRRFNNNVVLCRDDQGQEVVVFSKGVGFHELPYEIDVSKIEKSYYNIESRYIEMINSLSSEALEISRRTLDMCRRNLETEINPNLIFTLADHIDFSIERYRRKIKVHMPLYYDFENLYPTEYKISLQVLKMIYNKLNIRLPKDEIVGIGMNIINSEFDLTSSQPDKNLNQITENITKIIEIDYNIHINRNSGSYARYVSHMQYLIKRINNREQEIKFNEHMYNIIIKEYPKAATCANKISDYFIRTKKIKLAQDELLYLIIHINRITSREECNL